MMRTPIAVLLFGMLASFVYSTPYHVRNGGKDSNSGLDDANAWASLAKVKAATRNPGGFGPV